MARKPTGRPPGRPRSIRWRDVERAAEAGAELDDILAAFDIPREAAERHAQKLAAVVARGNAAFRLAVARRVAREGVGKGRSHSLLALARRHLGFDQKPEFDQQARLLEFMTQTKQQAVDTISRAVRSYRLNHWAASARTRCGGCGVAYGCPTCTKAGAERAPCCAEHDWRRPLEPEDGEPAPLPEPEEVGGDE